MEDWIDINSDISTSDSDNDITNIQTSNYKKIKEDLSFRIETNKIENIYKLKNGLIKINKHHKNIINNLTKEQKKIYLDNYNIIIGDSNEKSILAKIAYCIFHNIKNINNIKYKDTKIYGTQYWELYFKKIFKRLINFTKYSILYEHLYFNNLKIKSYNTFNLTGITNYNLKNCIEIWYFNFNKFNMVNKYIKNKYYKNYKKQTILSNKNCNTYHNLADEICKYETQYNKQSYYINNYINENNIDIIQNILTKAIFSYKFLNGKLVETDEQCIKNIYTSSAQIEGWYDYYYIILIRYFEDWKYKLPKNNKFIDNINFINSTKHPKYKII